MTSETMISGRDVVAAIRSAFRGSDTCHCHTVGKLGEDELVAHLVERKVIQPEEVYGPSAITLEMVRDGQGDWPYYTLRHQGVRYLIELCEYSHKDLCHLASMGPVKADQVERLLAKHGLLLKGGDPAIIERVRTEEAERGQICDEMEQALVDGEVSENVLEDTVEGLIKVAKSVLQDGGLLMNSAAKLLARKDGTGTRSRSYYVTILRRYAQSASRSRCAEVGRLITPVIALDEAERAAKKGGQKNAIARRRQASKQAQPESAERRESNVVRLRAS